MSGQLALVVAAGLLGPLFAAGRRPVVPVLIGELVAGVVIGQTGFGIVDASAQPFPAISAVGFAMLMLGAGAAVDLRSPALRQNFGRGMLAVLVALGISVPVGAIVSIGLAPGRLALITVLLVGSSAAIAFPAVVEWQIQGAAVPFLMTWITTADGLTALFMPLTLVGVGRIPSALLGDVLIILAGVAVVMAGDRLLNVSLVGEAFQESRQRGWALQLRLSVLLLLALAAIAERLGASLLIAGFAAGIVLRRFGEPHRLALQLSGVANGFFVPAFFVLLGATLDLRQLVSSPAAIALAVAMAVASVIVHVGAAAIAGKPMRVASGLLASAQLGLPSAAAALGLATRTLSPSVAAALVAGACLTLIPASIGTRLLAQAEARP